MKKLLLLILFPAWLTASEIDCENATTTRQISICAKLGAEQAKIELVKYLSKALEVYADQPNIVESINQSQQAWLTYRDRHCEVVYKKWGNASLRAVVFNECQRKLTGQRTYRIWEDFLTTDLEPLLPEPSLKSTE